MTKKPRTICIRCGREKITGTVIAKIAFGTLFILAGFLPPEEGWTVAYFLTALILGAALILWGLAPFLQIRKNMEQPSAAETDTLSPPERKACPSCGGIGAGAVCEYCGNPLPVHFCV